MSLVPEFEGELDNEVRQLLGGISLMREAAIGTNEQIKSLRQATARVPPITTPVKRGRSRMTAALDRLIKENQRGIANADNLVELIRGTLGDTD
jgi:hypothetical protein